MKLRKRILSLCMVVCMVLVSMFSVFADTADDAAKYLIYLYHANGEEEMVVGSEDTEIALADYTQEGEEVTGYAVTTGNDSVTIKDGVVKIAFTDSTLLCKVNVFFKKTVEMIGGTSTEVVEEGKKQYNTSEKGLQVDKSAEVDSSAVEGRTFDVTMEAWDVVDNANVGLVLDASGSMAFTSGSATPIFVGTGEGIETETALTAEQLADILNSKKTDNTKLGYAGYSYYVFDNRTSTMEFVPIGYWDGTSKDLAVREGWNGLPYEGIVGKYTFDELLPVKLTDEKQPSTGNLISESGMATLKNTTAKGVGSDYTGGSIKRASGFSGYLETKALDMQSMFTDTKKVLQLDSKLSGNEFSVTFAVKGNDDQQTNFEDSNIAYIGKSDGSSDMFKLTTKVSGGITYPAVEIGGSVVPEAAPEQGLLKASDWNIVTYTKDAEDNVVIYVDGVKVSEGKLDTEVTVGSKSVILIGGNGTPDEIGDNPLMLDEVYVYNKALDAAGVSSVVSAIKGGNEAVYVAPLYAATVGGTDVIADVDDDLVDEEGNTGAGWYYVSSVSAWDALHNALGTSKSFKSLPKTSTDMKIVNKVYVPEVLAETYGEVAASGDNEDVYIDLKDLSSSTLKGITDTDGINGTGKNPVIFFVDSEGYLRAFFSSGGASSERLICSYVYEKADEESVKVESLQKSLGKFLSKLSEVSPDSKVSAVRFSTTEANTDERRDELVLQDWTNDTFSSIGMLGTSKGNGGSSDSEDSEENTIKEYNYVLTGGTATDTGLTAYLENLDSLLDAADVNTKHIVVFTDGNNTGDESSAVAAATQLKEKGYTIYCVMLESGGANTEKAVEFLGKIASKPEYVYSTATSEGLSEAFITDICDNILGESKDYTVRDYIAPEFDLMDVNQIVYQLGAEGKVTYVVSTEDENGEAVPEAKEAVVNGEESLSIQNDVDVWANLFYDTEKGMYYLEWHNVQVPKVGLNASKLNVWSTTIKLVAKGEFIGGNAVLTNGNEDGMNKIFSDGDDGKNFPNPTVNVGLRLDPRDVDETIYEGRNVDPAAREAAIDQMNQDRVIVDEAYGTLATTFNQCNKDMIVDQNGNTKPYEATTMENQYFVKEYTYTAKTVEERLKGYAEAEKEVKAPVGAEVDKITGKSVATTYIVSGEIVVRLQMTKKDYEAVKEKAGGKLKFDYVANISRVANEKAEKSTVKITFSTDNVKEENGMVYVYSDPITTWEGYEGLPWGTYKVELNTEDKNEYFTFDKVSTMEVKNGVNAFSKKYNGYEEAFAATNDEAKIYLGLERDDTAELDARLGIAVIEGNMKVEKPVDEKPVEEKPEGTEGGSTAPGTGEGAPIFELIMVIIAAGVIAAYVYTSKKKVYLKK